MNRRENGMASLFGFADVDVLLSLLSKGSFLAVLHLNYTDGGCGFHRALQPARFCAPDFASMGHEILVGGLIPSTLSPADWFGVNGLPFPEAILDIARHKQKGGKFLWGLDDDLPAIPDWSPAKPADPHAMSIWAMCKSMADLIVVSTPALAATLADVSEKVMVAPNLLDLTSYPAWDAEAAELTLTLPVKVMWAGSNTHWGDVQQLVEPLDELMKRFTKAELQVAWFGSQPPAKLVRDHLHRGILYYQPGEKFQTYQLMLNMIAPDIELAPLDDIPFNHSKSALRVLEAWAMQACPVASPVSEYNCIRAGIDGRYATSGDEWLSTLSRLVGDHEYRVHLARAGRQRVEAEYNWQRYECRLPWLRVFARAFGCEVPPPPDILSN